RRGGQAQFVGQAAQVIPLGRRVLADQLFRDHALQQPVHRRALQAGAPVQLDQSAAAAVVHGNDAQQRNGALQRLGAGGRLGGGRGGCGHRCLLGGARSARDALTSAYWTLVLVELCPVPIESESRSS